MFVVDTNLLVYAAHRGVPEHERCRELVEEWRASRAPWFTTWPVIYEFMRVVTHARVLERPLTAASALEFVEAVVASPFLKMLIQTDRHADVLSQTLAEYPAVRGNLFHDFHTAVLMREHGVRRIYTRDSDFHRFRFLEVIDPLAA